MFKKIMMETIPLMLTTLIAVKESRGANRSVNTGANSSALCFNVEVETLSGPAAFLLRCCLNSFLTSCSCTLKGGGSDTANSGRLTDIGVEF